MESVGGRGATGEGGEEGRVSFPSEREAVLHLSVRCAFVSRFRLVGCCDYRSDRLPRAPSLPLI